MQVRAAGVLPGTGWPGDPAGAATPVAAGAPDVARLAAGASTVDGPDGLDARVSVCRACARLVAWREEVALARRAAFADQPYWGRPAPGFGPADARIAVLGLAPAAHGANRTGRVFTGDRSGDWLFAALHRAGLANQPTSVHAGDGLALAHTRIVASVRCAPPANKPTPAERDACRPWLARELVLLAPTLRVVVVLGAFGWQALWPALAAAGLGAVPSPRPVLLARRRGPGRRARGPRLLPRLAAEHLHRPADRADARRRPRPRARAGRAGRAGRHRRGRGTLRACAVRGRRPGWRRWPPSSCPPWPWSRSPRAAAGPRPSRRCAPPSRRPPPRRPRRSAAGPTRRRSSRRRAPTPRASGCRTSWSR